MTYEAELVERWLAQGARLAKMRDGNKKRWPEGVSMTPSGNAIIAWAERHRSRHSQIQSETTKGKAVAVTHPEHQEMLDELQGLGVSVHHPPPVDL